MTHTAKMRLLLHRVDGRFGEKLDILTIDLNPRSIVPTCATSTSFS